MKKLFALLVALVVLVSVFTMGVGAAGAINANEQKVIDKLTTSVKLGTTDFKIPDEYVQQAKNYFLTIDMTEDEANRVIAYINDGITAMQATTAPNATFSIGTMPQATKNAVLTAGQNAASVVNCTLSYNAAEDKVTITKNDGSNTVIFNSAPIIKKTGFEFDATAAVVTSLALVAVLCGVAVVSKKVKLF